MELTVEEQGTESKMDSTTITISFRFRQSFFFFLSVQKECRRECLTRHCTY